MEEFNLPEELLDAFHKISEIHKAQQRQAATMLAGFIATDERDLDYMDSFMDQLYDFIEPGSDTEELMRKYISHIATFNEKDAKDRLDDLEDLLGYKTIFVYAAGLVAQKLHKGQTDKGGNNYFTSHLLPVATSGFDWKEKVTGFLHDASEDCSVGVDEVMTMLEDETQRLLNTPQEEWWQTWMDDVTVPYPAPSTHLLTSEERSEIAETLNLMNHHTASTREEYINRMKGHFLAIKTKLNDLKSNMDLSRIPVPTQKDHDRITRYKKEQHRLYEFLNQLLM